MLVLSQNACSSSRHPPSLAEELHLSNHLGRNPRLGRYPSPPCFARKGNSAESVKISQTATAEFRISRPLPIVQCDRTQLAELFTNPIGNGIKYNDRDLKSIEIGYILPTESHADLPTDLQLDRSQSIFFVKDHGIGIRAKHFDNIFKIFKRLHPATKYGSGTGAGLTIAKKIVDRHGGNLVVTSIFGEGSTFYFTLGSRS